MQKILIIVLGMIFLSFPLVGCTEKIGLNIIREIPLPDDFQSMGSLVLQDSISEAAIDIEPLDSEIITDNESIKSLDELKEKALDKGYAVTDLLDIQVSFAGADVIGFNVEIGSYSMPIMKFPTIEATNDYINLIHMSDRYLTLQNGSYMTIVNITDGIVNNPEELEIMEYLLDTKAN